MRGAKTVRPERAEATRSEARRTPTAQRDADRERAFKMVSVAPDVAARLDRFVALLKEWQRRINLVAASSLAQLWTRHVADSLQLVPLAPAARIWIDLGSGAGFPGLVIACALAEQEGTRVHLVESNAKKAAFLREAVRVTGAPAEVHARRAEVFVKEFRGRADVVTARALKPLSELIELAAPLLQTGALGMFPKGRAVEAELTEARKYWSLQCTLVPSRTDAAARIVLVHSAQRRHKQ